MKRIIYILLVVSALSILIGGVTVFADDTDVNLTRVGGFDNNTVIGCTVLNEEDNGYGTRIEGVDDTANVIAEAKDTDMADTYDENAADGSVSNPVDSDKGIEKSNPFEIIFDTVKKHVTEILCALSFVGSLILAYFYKAGLLPIIKNGIGAIATTVSKIKETTERGEEKTEDLSKRLSLKLADTESALSELNSSLSDIENRLDRLADGASEQEKLKLILSAQIDMLYSIFMTSALPQYQKDEIGARIGEMREALLGYEKK